VTRVVGVFSVFVRRFSSAIVFQNVQIVSPLSNKKGTSADVPFFSQFNYNRKTLL
jgi:hypothetical protein